VANIEDQLSYAPDEEVLAFLKERQKLYSQSVSELAVPLTASNLEGDKPVTHRQLGMLAETLLKLSEGGTVAFALAIRTLSERIESRKHPQ
jgi:hypothetical protein